MPLTNSNVKTCTEKFIFFAMLDSNNYQTFYAPLDTK